MSGIDLNRVLAELRTLVDDRSIESQTKLHNTAMRAIATWAREQDPDINYFVAYVPYCSDDSCPGEPLKPRDFLDDIELGPLDVDIPHEITLIAGYILDQDLDDRFDLPPHLEWLPKSYRVFDLNKVLASSEEATA